MAQSNFVEFSKPFIDALVDTFEKMVHTEIKPQNPKIKTTSVARGDITAIIGMNGTVEKDGQIKDFKGLLALSWPEPLYVALAGRMLFEEYEEYNDEISDSGAEIANIVMGNAKGHLANIGYKIGMASPTSVRGNGHEIKYPPNTTVIEITIGTDIGDFSLEICYQEA